MQKTLSRHSDGFGFECKPVTCNYMKLDDFSLLGVGSPVAGLR